jgi:glutathione peroxidase
MAAKSIYDFEANTLDGQPQDLSAFKGQVLLVVNTASKCGLTPQYVGLEALYKKHHEQGLVVLGFPCNQFGNQESGSAAQIQSFCQKNYGVSFPMFEKIEVNGKNAHPLYKFLTAKLGGGLLGSKIKWNFTKFLIDREGNPVKRYAPTTTPEKIEKDIVKLLK